jgi:hypothetical protein
MSQTQMKSAVAACVLMLLVAGCSGGGGGSGSGEIHDPDSGHPKAWVTAHGAQCYSSSFEGLSCHAGGPMPHPLPFIDPALHGPQAKADLTVCQICHSDNPSGGPGSNPRFNVGIGALTNGCEDCHNANTAHAVPWVGGPRATTHPTAGNMANACPLCHGANLNGPAEGGVGPACGDCHTEGSPLTNTNCTSCHGEPPLDCDEATGTCN